MVKRKYHTYQTLAIYAGDLTAIESMPEYPRETEWSTVHVLLYASYMFYLVMTILNSRLVVGDVVALAVGLAVAGLGSEFGRKHAKSKIESRKKKNKPAHPLYYPELLDKQLWVDAGIDAGTMSAAVFTMLFAIDFRLGCLLLPGLFFGRNKLIVWVDYIRARRLHEKKRNEFYTLWRQFGNWLIEQKCSYLTPAEFASNYEKFAKTLADPAKAIEEPKESDGVTTNTDRPRTLTIVEGDLEINWKFGERSPEVKGDKARVIIATDGNAPGLATVYIDGENRMSWRYKNAT
jgi:hypothetical protein